MVRSCHVFLWWQAREAVGRPLLDQDQNKVEPLVWHPVS